jgi:hypothetical protein
MSRLFWEWRRRNLERILYLAAIVLTMMAIALASGCNKGNIDVTNPDDRFMVAQDGFNAALSSYNYQLRTADAATKAKWKEDIWPHFVTANEALNAWDESRNDAVKERAYINLQRSLFDILIKTGIIEEEPQ